MSIELPFRMNSAIRIMILKHLPNEPTTLSGSPRSWLCIAWPSDGLKFGAAETEKHYLFATSTPTNVISARNPPPIRGSHPPTVQSTRCLSYRTDTVHADKPRLFYERGVIWYNEAACLPEPVCNKPRLSRRWQPMMIRPTAWIVVLYFALGDWWLSGRVSVL